MSEVTASTLLGALCHASIPVGVAELRKQAEELICPLE